MSPHEWYVEGITSSYIKNYGYLMAEWGPGIGEENKAPYPKGIIIKGIEHHAKYFIPNVLVIGRHQD